MPAGCGLPPLLGYLLAGVAVGPFTPGFVADAKLAPQLAEIGVILLMFGVGMHFSLRDLLAVRNIAIPGALVQIAVAVVLTCAVAHFWGWQLWTQSGSGVGALGRQHGGAAAGLGSGRNFGVAERPNRRGLADCRRPGDGSHPGDVTGFGEIVGWRNRRRSAIPILTITPCRSTSLWASSWQNSSALFC